MTAIVNPPDLTQPWELIKQEQKMSAKTSPTVTYNMSVTVKVVTKRKSGDRAFEVAAP